MEAEGRGERSDPGVTPNQTDVGGQLGTARRLAEIVALVVAGEAIFVLPFVVARVFRPTLLEVFGLTNLEYGLALSAYGAVAMVAYFIGGPLADRYTARRLMTLATLGTAAGGILFVQVPGLTRLVWLYAWWGMTSVLLFWAPLIRATREWGGEGAQGRAYGLLDGGRGAFAGLLGSGAVALFASLLPVDVAGASLAERESALVVVLWWATAMTAGSGALVWCLIPDRTAALGGPEPGSGLRRLRVVAGMPTLWIQALIVVCAYVGYKSIDNLSLYAHDALGYDDVEAAKVGALALWVRPFAAIGMGLVADRWSASSATALSFAIMTAGALMIALGLPMPGLPWMLAAAVITTCVGVCALRGTYYALLGEGRVPLAFTGTAVGVVSVVGYTPDVFSGPLMGWILDRSPGALGHQHLFGLVAACGGLGLLLALAFRRLTRAA